jgi:hypothetical protein
VWIITGRRGNDVSVYANLHVGKERVAAEARDADGVEEGVPLRQRARRAVGVPVAVDGMARGIRPRDRDADLLRPPLAADVLPVRVRRALGLA